MTIQEKVTGWLFSTKAIKISEPDQPFWYTSGTLGPFYINTHFLFGGEGTANQLLSLIESFLDSPLDLPAAVAGAVMAQYEADPVYRELCGMMADQIRGQSLDWISGGERRDFFFSFMVARLLKKPHLAILKDGRVFASDSEGRDVRLVPDGTLAGGKVIHVVDIVTEASSFKRAWIPAIERCGAVMPAGLAVLDRKQGGREFLSSAHAELLALAEIGRPLFLQALSGGVISSTQFEMIDRFLQDPNQFMIKFIEDHPDFIDLQLSMGGKNREKALLYLQRSANS
jgi:orotate phosphoribosyltransferase